MRILVTGATGFIGEHLCRALSQRGHEVLALVRPGTDWSALRGMPHLRVVYGSVRSAEWQQRVGAVDVSMHLAADWSRLNSADDVALLDRLAEAGLGRMVFFSSVCAAGLDHCAHPIPDDVEPRFRPDDFYGSYKWSAEQELRGAAERAGVKLAILRPTIVYGQGDRGNLRPLVEAVGQGRMALWARGETLVRLCSVENLVRVACEGVEGGLDGLTLNVGDAECLPLGEVACRIAGALEVEPTCHCHGALLARRRAWLRFVTNRFGLTDSFATHFAYDKWTRAFDADIAGLQKALPGLRLGGFDARLAVSGVSIPVRPPLPGWRRRLVGAVGIALEMVRFRVRRYLAKRGAAC